MNSLPTHKRRRRLCTTSTATLDCRLRTSPSTRRCAASRSTTSLRRSKCSPTSDGWCEQAARSSARSRIVAFRRKPSAAGWRRTTSSIARSSRRTFGWPAVGPSRPCNGARPHSIEEIRSRGLGASRRLKRSALPSTRWTTHCDGIALEEATGATVHGDVPIGAVVLVGGEVIARRHNERERFG